MHFENRYQAEKARRKGVEVVVKTGDGYTVMEYSEYYTWKKQK